MWLDRDCLLGRVQLGLDRAPGTPASALSCWLHLRPTRRAQPNQRRMGPSPAPPDDPEPHSLLLPDLAGLAGPGDWLKGWVKAVGPPTELPGYQLWAVQQRLA